MDDLEGFEAAAAWAEPIFAAVQHADLDAPSINDGWTVRVLTAHIIHGTHMFARGLRGVDVSNDAPKNNVTPFDEANIAGAYRAAIADVRAAAAEDGNLDRIVSLPIGPTPGTIVMGVGANELALHGWDLASSIGMDVTIPDDLASWLEEKNRPTAPRMVEFGVYAPEVDVPEDASPHSRLLALTGRSG
ncbi:MAG: TIGR03086 family metal-binding protein [Nitriliruptorales bacterium]|nr:TIGR03086 family metal-binding protein [Nitriliruptorales bacterium]